MADGVDVKSLRTPRSTEEVDCTPSMDGMASVREFRYLSCRRRLSCTRLRTGRYIHNGIGCRLCDSGADLVHALASSLRLPMVRVRERHRLGCAIDTVMMFHHISGTELVDSKESSRSIALEIKESIDTSFPLAGNIVERVERVRFGGIDTAFCAKIRLCGRCTICIKAVVYVVGIVPDFIVFIGKRFRRRVVWVKGKALIFLPIHCPSQPQNHSNSCSSGPLLASDLNFCHVFQPATIKQYFHGGHVVHSGFARRDIAFIFLPWQSYDGCFTC